ncbi:hypothetical protein [Epilithonimonas hominis]|uniref:hypothetical protein n=1 Tax=Epilithonimonas hominis TaxID=420404 RepID=UPI00289A16B7|nr:hypothetical protein [Epilithonimonas hominis]
METFGGITIDDLHYYPYQDYGAGIRTQLLYAPAEFFDKIVLPEIKNEFEQSLIIIEDNFKFKESLNWATIDILIDENELKTTIEGGAQQKKTRSELNFYVLGFRKKILGFLENLKNVPMVFGIKDSEGTIWILGNLRNRAFIESAEATTGKKYEENSGVSVKVSAKSAIYAIMKDKYKVYSATITQSGTSAPLATELENTLGAVTFIYQSPGTYIIRSNAFDSKTVINNNSVSRATLSAVVDGPNAVPGGTIAEVLISVIRSGNDFKIVSKNINTLNAEDGLIQDPTFLEIRKYQD